MITVATNTMELLDVTAEHLARRAREQERDLADRMTMNGHVIVAKAVWRSNRAGRSVYRCWELDGRKVGRNHLAAALRRLGLAE